MRRECSRRAFHTAALAASGIATVATEARGARGAHERVRLGCIGVGNRGVQLLNAFVAQPDAQVVALADVYEPYLHNRYRDVDPRFAALGGRIPRSQPDFGDTVERYSDFRRILDRADIDAVIVATPDHWHAIQTILACEAGKDVYVEKPLCVTIREGRRMVDASSGTARSAR
jgi:predicted dehydrogenase